MSMFRKNDTDASTLYFQSVLDTERHKPYGKLRQHPSKLGQHFIKGASDPASIGRMCSSRSRERMSAASQTPKLLESYYNRLIAEIGGLDLSLHFLKASAH